LEHIPKIWDPLQYIINCDGANTGLNDDG
jgi:hypothetical protein